MAYSVNFSLKSLNDGGDGDKVTYLMTNKSDSAISLDSVSGVLADFLNTIDINKFKSLTISVKPEKKKKEKKENEPVNLLERPATNEPQPANTVQTVSRPATFQDFLAKNRKTN